MLHPEQFAINQAWIGFRLSTAPIHTGRDGDFHCVALMDAASGYILGSELVTLAGAPGAALELCALLQLALGHTPQQPATLFLPPEPFLDPLADEAVRLGIEVVRVPENELLIFTGEARQGFTQQFDRPSH